VLATLRRAGHPYQASPTQLTAAVLVTSATMTCCLTRLSAKDLIQRVPNPTDHRSVLVTLSTEGRTRIDAALADLLDVEHRLLGGLPPPQRDQLAGLLRTLLAPFDHGRPTANGTATRGTRLSPPSAARVTARVNQPTALGRCRGRHDPPDPDPGCPDRPREEHDHRAHQPDRERTPGSARPPAGGR
jgi:DNA-binding MarR family transcriptional regulator